MISALAASFPFTSFTGIISKSHGFKSDRPPVDYLPGRVSYVEVIKGASDIRVTPSVLSQ